MTDASIGIIGTDNTHAHTYAAFINGWSEEEPAPTRLPNGASVPEMHLWAMLLRQLEGDPVAQVPVPGARVTAVWSADRWDAERIARACGIDRVCGRPDEACEDVDAVMVLTERPESHLPYARLALERGRRTYIDKPLAESLDAAREIFAIADRLGVPCFTGSVARWSPELLAGRDYVLGRFGRPRALYVSCPLDLELYGIHCVEMVNLFLGSDVTSVEAIQGADRQVVLLQYRNGASAVFEHLKFLRSPSYSITVYGETWQHRIPLDEPYIPLLEFARSFVDFARGGPAPVSPEETLQLIAILAAAQQSLSDGVSVNLPQVDER